MKKIHTVPGKFEIHYDEEVRAVIVVVTNYTLSLEDYKTGVLDKGIGFTREFKAKAWIIDSSNASGCFSEEIFDFIRTTVVGEVKAIGASWLIIINSKVNNLARLNVYAYIKHIETAGVKTIHVDSLDEAKAWLKVNT